MVDYRKVTVPRSWLQGRTREGCCSLVTSQDDKSHDLFTEGKGTNTLDALVTVYLEPRHMQLTAAGQKPRAEAREDTIELGLEGQWDVTRQSEHE